jgi:hypothetical protein
MDEIKFKNFVEFPVYYKPSKMVEGKEVFSDEERLKICLINVSSIVCVYPRDDDKKRTAVLFGGNRYDVALSYEEAKNLIQQKITMDEGKQSWESE